MSRLLPKSPLLARSDPDGTGSSQAESGEVRGQDADHPALYSREEEEADRVGLRLAMLVIITGGTLGWAFIIWLIYKISTLLPE